MQASAPETGLDRQLAGVDLQPGSLVAHRRVLLDQAAFSAFSALTGDAHPIHDDEAYARAKGLRAPIAHGLLLTAITALGATSLSAQLRDSMLAMVGVEAEFLSPVFVGDEVQLRFLVGGVEHKSRGRSLVTFNIEVLSSAQLLHARVCQRFLLKTQHEEQRR